MRHARLWGVLAIVISVVLWAATGAVGLEVVREAAESRGLGVLEGLLRAAACTFTISAAVLYRAACAGARRFEHGYLAGLRDGTPRRVTSIRSHRLMENVPLQDHHGSNKL